MIINNGCDPCHEGQTCRHVQVQVKGLAEPAKHNDKKKRKLMHHPKAVNKAQKHIKNEYCF